MAGYAVVFDSIFTGTLCGKYPDTAAWLFLLALKDKNGVIDMTPQYISSVTGMPVADLLGCIGRFMEPDPHSRSTVEDGRRLVSLAPDRDWGWRIVNHATYREKARLISKSEREVTTGSNRDRLKTAAHRRSPPKTAADPLSDADADADKERERVAPAPLVLHASLPSESWEEWLSHRREKHLSMSPRALKKQLKLLAQYSTDVQREIIDTSINAGWEGLFPPKGRAQNGASEWR